MSREGFRVALAISAASAAMTGWVVACAFAIGAGLPWAALGAAGLAAFLLAVFVLFWWMASE